MSRPVSSIRNLGPASDILFARAGLTSAEQVEALGADATYARLLAQGTRPHFIGYYALVMGLQGRLWTDIGIDEKTALRLRFDTLKGRVSANDKGRLQFEAALDTLGVIDQPTSSRPEKK